MSIKTNNNSCGVSLGSVTIATKAQRALANAAIYSELIKFENDRLGKGCSYGLEFSCAQKRNVDTVLHSAGIRPRNYFENEGGEWH